VQFHLLVMRLAGAYRTAYKAGDVSCPKKPHAAKPHAENRNAEILEAPDFAIGFFS